MPLVVDASVSVSWLMSDERHPIADAAYARIVHDRAFVPSLWWYEVRNVIIVNERRGRLDTTASARALRLLGELPVVIDAEPQEAALMDIARRHQLTVYDAAYIELAVRRRQPLATLDAALSIAARAERVPLIGHQ
jgi:predicted nucleic acid-binding protein